MILLASLIVAALAGYAAYLAIKLRQQAKLQRQLALEREAQKQQQQAQCRKSIRILAATVLSTDHQITLTEAAIRISVLSTQLEPEELAEGNYLVFRQLAEATAHIPILDGWKKLKTAEKIKFDAEREAIEQKYRELLLAAARTLAEGDKTAPLFYPA